MGTKAFSIKLPTIKKGVPYLLHPPLPSALQGKTYYEPFFCFKKKKIILQNTA
jgi:hypothetical protein